MSVDGSGATLSCAAGHAGHSSGPRDTRTFPFNCRYGLAETGPPRLSSRHWYPQGSTWPPVCQATDCVPAPVSTVQLRQEVEYPADHRSARASRPRQRARRSSIARSAGIELRSACRSPGRDRLSRIPATQAIRFPPRSNGLTGSAARAVIFPTVRMPPTVVPQRCSRILATPLGLSPA